LWTGTTLGNALFKRLLDVEVLFSAHDAQHTDGPLLCVDDTLVYLTDGRTATQRAADNGHQQIVLVDLTFYPEKARRIALARSDACSESAYLVVVAVFQAAGFEVSRLEDVPGMAVMRTVAMLANEAADAVNQGVCDVVSVDIAMQKGMNYPRGPLAWADDIGPAYVLTVLDHLAQVYGEDRYRASPLLRRIVASDGQFHIRQGDQRASI
jgi:3-hydroxybutyryl-CoA dehydrogenase